MRLILHHLDQCLRHHQLKRSGKMAILNSSVISRLEHLLELCRPIVNNANWWYYRHLKYLQYQFFIFTEQSFERIIKGRR